MVTQRNIMEGKWNVSMLMNILITVCTYSKLILKQNLHIFLSFLWLYWRTFKFKFQNERKEYSCVVICHTDIVCSDTSYRRNNLKVTV